MMMEFALYSIKLVKAKKVKYEPQGSLTSPSLVAKAARSFYESPDREILSVLLLDTKNRIIGANIISVGTLTESPVHPREVFKPAILANAASVILVHNHPSGDPSPSYEDIQITLRLREAGKLLGIQVLDHIILGEENYASLLESGFLGPSR